MEQAVMMLFSFPFSLSLFTFLYHLKIHLSKLTYSSGNCPTA